MSHHEMNFRNLIMPERAVLRADGLYVREANDQGEIIEVWLCSPIWPLRVATRQGSVDFHVQFRFENMFGEIQTILIPREKLFSGTSAITELLKVGLEITVDPGRKGELASILSQMVPDERALLSGRLGWQEGNADFVLPDGSSIGAQTVIYDGSDSIPNSRCGTLEGWRSGVARYALDNDLLTVGISLAFAAPLLRQLGVPSGMLHLHGGSSTGKSTILAVAASVFAGPRHVESWRVTDSALERVAEAHSGRLLVLDELGEVNGQHFNASTYMLANGKGKGRYKPNAKAHAYVPSWELLGLSSGELSVAEKLQEADIALKDGQRARILNIRADKGGHGVYDALHRHPSGRHLSDALLSAAGSHHGVAGPAWIKAILSDLDGMKAKARAEMQVFEALVDQRRPDTYGWIHGRVRHRFALIAAAGELASAVGITGWPPGTARDAAFAVYAMWLEDQGPSPEERARAADAALRDRLRLFLKTHLHKIRDLRRPEASDPDIDDKEYSAWIKDDYLYLSGDAWSALFGTEGSKASKRLVELGVLDPEGPGELMRKLPREAGLGGRRAYRLQLAKLKSELPTGDCS